MKRLFLAALLGTTFLTPVPAEAGPAAAILGAAFATWGPLGSTIATAGFLGTTLGSFLARAALGLALNALTPKARAAAATGTGYQVTASGSALDHQVIYGETKVAGVRIYDAVSGTNNAYLHRVVAFAGHEVEEFTQVWLNDYLLTVNLTTGAVTSAVNDEETTTRFNNYVRIIARSGTDTQIAIPEMVSEAPEWTSEHRLRGIAYLYIRLQFNSDVFPNGVPEITATIKGKKVYDPRTGLTAWSNNPALCLRDYLTNPNYGMGSSTSEVDDVLIAQAANVCEQTVESEARYTCNGAFTTGAEPGEVVQNMLTSMGGLLWHAQGKWRMKPAYYTTPVLSLTEDDLRSGLRVQTRASRRENFNIMRGTWRGPDSNWQETDYTPVTDSAFVLADGGVEQEGDLDLPFTTSHLTAQRIARVALRQQREQITISGTFGLRAFAVQIGDTVQITNSRFGWTNKTFEVIEWTFTFTEELALEVQMTLRETSADIYTSVSGAVFEGNNTSLPSPYYVAGIGLTATVRQVIQSEKVTNFINVDVTAADPRFIDYVEVQFRESGTSDWNAVGTGDLGRYEVIDVEPATYDVRARAYNTFGVRGEWEELSSIDVTGKLTPPSDVTGLFVDLVGGTVTVDWDPISDQDLSHYIVRHAIEESGATWANATFAAPKVARPASEITLPVKPGTYMVRAQDKSGNQSTNYASAVVPAAALESFATRLTLDENGTFGGTFGDTSVSSGKIVLTDTSTAPSTGNYTMSGYLDAGSVRRFRARVDVTTARLDSGSGLWDDIPGTFDTFPGTFDDWTGDVQFADTDVRTFMRTTNDDPAGTPTWSAWRTVKAGDFYARAAQFGATLRSTSVGVTPAVSRLTAIMEYN